MIGVTNKGDKLGCGPLACQGGGGGNIVIVVVLCRGGIGAGGG